MRKLLILIFIFVSVLNSWGQDNDFNLTEIKAVVDSLKSKNQTVKTQAQALSADKLSGDKKLQVDSLLNETFENLYQVIDLCETNDTCQKEAKLLIKGFIDSYTEAIYNGAKTAIYINSQSFYDVAESSNEDFKKFILRWSKLEVISKDKIGLGEADVEKIVNKILEKELEDVDNTTTDWNLFAFLGGLGILGIILALVSINRCDKKSQKNAKEINELRERLSQEIEKLTKAVADNRNAGAVVPPRYAPKTNSNFVRQQTQQQTQ